MKIHILRGSMNVDHLVSVSVASLSGYARKTKRVLVGILFVYYLVIEETQLDMAR